MGFLITIILLSILILIHELGHFLMAKRFRVKTEKFSLGFGPKLFSLKPKDTEYIFSAIPLGGYVKLAGDTQAEFKGLSYEYLSKSVSQRAKIIFIGPILNYILAFFLLWTAFYFGYPHLSTEVGETIPDFPAERAGILRGDIIKEIDGVGVSSFEDMQKIIQEKEDKVNLKVIREEKEIVLDVGIQKKEIIDIFGKKKTIGLIGIKPSEDLIFLRQGFFKSFISALEKLSSLTILTFKAIWAILTGSLSLRESITGPLGVFYITTQTLRLGICALLHLMAVLSLSLAIFNLLPLPILDGGNLLLLWIEGLRRRRFSIKTEEVINRTGLILIIFLTSFVFYNDLVRFGFLERIMRLFKR